MTLIGPIEAESQTAAGLVLRVTPWREFATTEARAEWDGLTRRAASPNPFFEPWFLLPALEHFDPRGRVSIARVHHGSELVALMPLARTLDYGNYPLPHWTTWLHANAFCGEPLLAPGAETSFACALLEWLDNHAGVRMFAHFCQLPEDGAFAAALLAANAVRPHGIVRREERALLSSKLSPEMYLADAMTTKKRKELRRQRKRLGEEGALAFHREEGEAGLESWIADFLALEAAGWKGANGSAIAGDRRTAALFRAALQGGAERGKLERLSLTLDSKPIAMLANFLTPPGAFSFKTAFDERFARFSPGVLLQLENLALLDRCDIAWCDSCAAADHPMIERIWREHRTMLGISVAIGGPLRRKLYAPMLAREMRSQKNAP